MIHDCSVITIKDNGKDQLLTVLQCDACSNSGVLGRGHSLVNMVNERK